MQVSDDVYDLTPLVLDNIEYLGLDYLVTHRRRRHAVVLQGARPSRRAAHRHPQDDGQRRPGHRVLHRLLDAPSPAPRSSITRQRTTLGSHERIGVFRIFGRDAGFSALYTAYVTSARCVIPEAPFDLERLIDVLVEDKRANPSRYAFVIASEGAIWQGGVLAEFGETDAYRPSPQGRHRLRAGRGDQEADPAKRRFHPS